MFNDHMFTILLLSASWSVRRGTAAGAVVVASSRCGPFDNIYKFCGEIKNCESPMTRHLSRASCGDSAMFTRSDRPEVKIIVQPASTHRFRYKSEGRWAGSIPGDKKNSYPTIEISGCSGKAFVVISCVTKDAPYRSHPHGVVAREIFSSDEEVKKGACKVKVELTGRSSQLSFNNIGIQSTTRNEVKEMLRMRNALRLDPFNNGFSYTHLKSIDLNAVRLCFQVVVVDEDNKPRYALPPIVSNVIRDKKTVYELDIARTSHCAGPAAGGTSMILLCKKVKADDVAVVFFEKSEGREVWEASATDMYVHQNYAIAFKTPPYHDVAITKKAQVYLQLKQISNNARSNPVGFEYFVSPKDRLKSILRKPLPSFPQSFTPMEIEEADSSCTPDLTNQVVDTHKQVNMDSDHKLVPQWPLTVDLPPLQGPGPSLVGCLSLGEHVTHQNYLQLDHARQDYSDVYPQPSTIAQRTPSLITEPPYLGINHSKDDKGHYTLNHQYTNGHGGHVEPDTASPDTPSTIKRRYTASDEMRLDSDHFSDICDSDISDSLSGLSLKDLIPYQTFQGVWKPDTLPSH